MDLEQSIMMIIIHSGDARAYAYEALHKTNEGDYEGAEEAMKNADDAIGEAHDIQTSFLQKEAAGEKTEISVLFVHAQDHLMTAISEKNLIKEIVSLRKYVNSLAK